MGINLKDLTVIKPINLAELRGKKLGVDAYNMLYQFLSSIRQPDGMPLQNSEGVVTSHLRGLLSRVSYLNSEGIKLCFVFDGVPHPLKRRLLDERKERKKKAQREWEEALIVGDLERARMKAQQTSILTDKMIDETKEVLDALGVPWVQAPSEGEAQAATMVRDGILDAVASQDFDTLLYGAPIMIRNLTLSGKRKLPRQQKWINIEMEKIVLEKVLEENQITQEQLIDLAILIGTDYNRGIHGIGPKKGIKIIKECGNAEKCLEKLDQQIDNLDELRKMFLDTKIYSTKNVDVNWKEPVKSKTIELLCGKYEFSKSRVDNALDKFFGPGKGKAEQVTLGDFK